MLQLPVRCTPTQLNPAGSFAALSYTIDSALTPKTSPSAHLLRGPAFPALFKLVCSGCRLRGCRVRIRPSSAQGLV